jgi:hypothetical protein
MAEVLQARSLGDSYGSKILRACSGGHEAVSDAGAIGGREHHCDLLLRVDSDEFSKKRVRQQLDLLLG